MKKILMLGTGGTIASEITESGLSPQLTTEQILHYCPDISGFCSVDCLQLCNLDSTNIAPEHWQRGCPRGFYRIQWSGDPRDPRTQNTLQELSGVFQHQLP